MLEAAQGIGEEPAEPSTPKPKPSGLKRPSGIATPSSGIKPPGSSGLRMPSAIGAKVCPDLVANSSCN